MPFPVQVTEIINQKRPGPNRTGTIFVGSHVEKADLAIQGPEISEVHAQLEEDGDTGQLFVTDLDSAFGTFLNGQRISGKTKVNPGDHLSFGSSPAFVLARNAFAHA
eukprot:CAMPEP_0177597804 /NCGR_PEP_ID=MMETSP0419_2-20121207/11930_1 /TAXON_ID=582737 /ORGANISM="Tetraselmis sp., Strain GSL018" /LENGTH=106 /DNA_ID=CAMNT_0019090045 /DNA_START=328 /DNA_END=648 /DNA_ORIENTATION=+